MPAPLERLLDLAWPGHPTTGRAMVARVLPVLGNSARLAGAALLAYLLTRWLLHGPIDLTSALTALLVLQASAATSFRKGLLRVVAVGLGVGTAVLFAGWFGMHWWSLGLVIFSSLVVARVLRLGDSALEVPISAMLILGSVGADVAAENRVIATVIGTVVGMVLPLVVPPAIPFRSVSAAVHGVAEEERDLLMKAADDLNDRAVTREMIDEWLVRSRRITSSVASAHQRIDSLSEVRRFNSRAMGTADISPILRSGLDSLEHCLIALRAVMLLMARNAPQAEAARPDWISSQVQHALAGVLRDLGACLASFGQMVEAEANGNEADAQAVFARNYRAVRDARADLRHLMESEQSFEHQWMVRGSLLGGIDQMLAQVDLDARKRVRQRWKATQLGRSLPQAHIGPRTTTFDRYRLERMRARQQARLSDEQVSRQHEETQVDFTGDAETTQQLPRITARIVDPSRRRDAASPSTPNLPD